MKNLLLLTLILISMSAGAVTVRVTLVENDSGSSCGAVFSTAFKDGDCPEGPPNDPPSWGSTPSPTTVEGVGGSYDLLDDVSDPNGDTLTCSLNASSESLPTGVTLNSNCSFSDNGTGSAGTTTGIIVDADDGTAAAVASDAFSYVISSGGFATMSPAGNTILPGFACYGCKEWKDFIDTNPDYEFKFITNLNTSGAGSLDAAISNCTAGTVRFVIPEVSGKIPYSAGTGKAVTCDNLVYWGQFAPSPGLSWQGLRITIRGVNRSLWMHASCFGESSSQSTGKCFAVSTVETSNDVILMNYSCAFNYDGCIDVSRTQNRVSLIQGQHLYPAASGNPRQCALLGDDGTLTDIMMIRGVGTHFTARCPSMQTGTMLVANNVAHNAGNYFLDIAKVEATGSAYDIERNLYTYGTDTGSGIRPIGFDFFGLGGIDEDFDVYVSENRAQGRDDSTQSNLIVNNSGGHANLTGESAITRPTGYVSTAIAAGKQGKWDFANLICDNSGARPTDRLAIWQQACDELENLFDGTGSTGSLISSESEHSLGYPTIAENSCDTTIAGDCGTGWPAVPVGDPKAAGSFIDATWSAGWDQHCNLMPAGATGC